MRRFYQPAGQALTFVGVEWSTRSRHGTGCWRSRIHCLRLWNARPPNLTRSYSRKQCDGGWMRPGDWVRPAQPVRPETAMATRQGTHASHSWDRRHGPLHWRPPVTIGWQICRPSPGERWSYYWIRSDTSAGIVAGLDRPHTHFVSTSAVFVGLWGLWFTGIQPLTLPREKELAVVQRASAELPPDFPNP